MGRKKKAETENTVHPAPKVRKEASGPLRDKSRTKARMTEAVGKVLQNKGYPGLTASNIALAAGVDKKLVWTYFGGVDNLIEEYIRQKYFLKSASQSYIDNLLKHPEMIGQKEIENILQSQFDTLYKDKAQQKVIHWELGEKNKVLREVADKRKEISEQLFAAILPDFAHAAVDLRARLALLIGGIYYVTLHAKSNGGLFCGIDINQEKGKGQIKREIQNTVFELYEKAGVNK